jgi:hypothetical protein
MEENPGNLDAGWNPMRMWVDRASVESLLFAKLAADMQRLW